jgi:hypothetical protein
MRKRAWLAIQAECAQTHLMHCENGLRRQGLLYPVDQSSPAFACDRHQNKPAPKLIRHRHTARILLCKMCVAAMTNLKCGRRDAQSQS